MSRIHLLLSGIAVVTLIGCGQETTVQETTEPVDAIEVSEAEFQNRIEGSGLVLAKFGAPWCGPCVKVEAELNKLVKPSGSQVMVALINVDEEPGLAEKYEISAIPVLLLFKDGKKVEEWLGFEDASVFQESIDQALAQSNPVGEVRENNFVESE